ncbi:MAG: hypothetical protein M1827_007360 [Pycnora praestabilis]|nr:MAG: hypothetical protein M1827_007360 [Pycnora praestabilis]
MATKKDVRREDLIIPYVEPEKSKSEGDVASTMSSTLPMAAMFTRNRWVVRKSPDEYEPELILNSHAQDDWLTWLAETPEQKRTGTTPAIFSVGMAFLAVVVTYIPLFLPPTPGSSPATGTEAPPAAPPS